MATTHTVVTVDVTLFAQVLERLALGSEARKAKSMIESSRAYYDGHAFAMRQVLDILSTELELEPGEGFLRVAS